MKPLRFNPLLKTSLWGGEKIARYKGIVTELSHVGESWELSGVEGRESVVAEGEFAGWALSQLVDRFRGALVGEHVFARYGNEFPLLVKFLDARQELSVQVHPDDELAQQRHGKRGKAEMWYVVETEGAVRLKCGFSQEMTPAEYDRRVADKTITDVLAEYALAPGDVFFLPAGRVHAIGRGAFIAEIQQTSDLTYRIYDYDRLDIDGKPCQLHTGMARDAID